MVTARDRHSDLGRRRGLFVPAAEASAYLACGWRLADDLAGMSGADDMLLIAPPPAFNDREAAA